MCPNGTEGGTELGQDCPPRGGQSDLPMEDEQIRQGSAKVEDLSEKMNILVAFILIDSIRGGIFAISLWITCKLNMFEAYCTLVVKYGIMILVQLMRVMNPVICYYLINLYDNLLNQKILHSFLLFCRYR